MVLALAGSASGTPHTVRVNNVEDVAGNPIAANTTEAIFEAAGPADIVINEVMRNPDAISDSEGEWFEVYNAGSNSVDMNGWTIKDNDFDSHVIDNGGTLIIGAGEYKVFCRNATAMAGQGVTSFYQYSGIAMGNSADELILEDNLAVVVDGIAWDDGTIWPDAVGFSMQWTGLGDNNDGTTWEDIGGPRFGTQDRGTPGTVNDWISDVERVMRPAQTGEDVDIDDETALKLFTMIRHTISHDSWYPNGTAHISVFDGVLMVLQTRENHQKVRELLERLRAARNLPTPQAAYRASESVYKADGQLAPWTRQLLKAVADGTLSPHSTVTRSKRDGAEYITLDGVRLRVPKQ